MTALWSRGCHGYGAGIDEQNYAWNTEEDGNASVAPYGNGRASDFRYEVQGYTAWDHGDGWGDGRSHAAWIRAPHTDAWLEPSGFGDGGGSHHGDDEYNFGDALGYPEQDVEQPQVAVSRAATLEFGVLPVAQVIAIANARVAP